MPTPATPDPAAGSKDSWRALLQNIVTEGRQIAGHELDQVKQEIERKSHITKQAVILGVGAAVCALLALTALSGAVIYGLDQIMALWLALVLVGVTYGAMALLLIRKVEQHLGGKASSKPPSST